jgi:hypothetical protein
MRYREMNSFDDISRDVAVAVNFIGQDEYRQALKKIGTDLNSKGFVTPSDDASFALELDLFNIEKSRIQCSGSVKSVSARCHAGVDFLVGLTKDGITYEVEAKAISTFTGCPIKPENLDKLLVEVKQHFVWNDSGGIPLIAATLSSSLASDLHRSSSVVRSEKEAFAILGAPDARFVGCP